MKTRRLDPTKTIVVALVVLLMLVGITLQHGGGDPGAPNARFEDAGPLGGRGVALLLQRLGYNTKRQTEPLQAMPRDARVWFLVNPSTDFSVRETDLLLRWVRNGGTLVMAASRVEEGPRFTLEQKLEIAEYINEVALDYGGRSLPNLVPYSFTAVSRLRTGVQKASGSPSIFSGQRAQSVVPLAGIPGGDLLFAPYGRGRVIVAPDAWLFTNYALSRDDNAVLISNFVRAHAESGTVYFDERARTGDSGEPVSSEPKTLLQTLFRPPYVWATSQFLLAAFLAVLLAGRRLGAATPLPSTGPVTRASQFAGAMGALFRRTNRAEAAALIIGHHFRRRLAQRLGLSPEDPDSVLAQRAHEIGGLPFDLLDRLLLQSRAPQGNEAQLLRDASEMERVLRKLEGKE